MASLAPSQQLYADEVSLTNVDCTANPTAPFCVVYLTLPTDPAIVPAYPWNDGRTYIFGEAAFTSGLTSSDDLGGIARPHVNTVDFYHGNGTFVTLDSVLQTDGSGSYLLTLPGGATIGSYDDFVTINATQVHEHVELIAIHVRSVRGPGGQTEGHGIGTHRITYPENPGLPQGAIVTDNYDLPRYNLNDALPAELVADVPTLAGHSFVLASPFGVTVLSGFDAPYGYDVYTFGASSGSTERQAKSYTFSVTGPGSFSLNFAADSTTAEVNFVNEESPGIWRVTMHATGPSSEQFFDGLLMETVGVGSGFTVANVAGNSFRAELNSHSCGGPYALVSVLDPQTICAPPYFGWIFGASNTVNKLRNGAAWGVWQLPSGADAGRLLFAQPSFVAMPILQERGWEVVRSDVNYTDMWVLENVTTSPDGGTTTAPPIIFKPAGRLSHVTKQ